MNKCILVGRMTKDAELKTTANGISVCTFTVAVNRRFKNADGNYDADFINCVAWRQQAEFVCKYFGKGKSIGIVGNIQSRTYDNKDGQKVYVTEVAVDEVDFVGSNGENKENNHTPTMSETYGEDADIFKTMPMPDGDLPF